MGVADLITTVTHSDCSISYQAEKIIQPFLLIVMLSETCFRINFEIYSFWGVIDVDILFLSCLDSNHQCEDKSDRRGKLM